MVWVCQMNTTIKATRNWKHFKPVSPFAVAAPICGCSCHELQVILINWSIQVRHAFSGIMYDMLMLNNAWYHIGGNFGGEFCNLLQIRQRSFIHQLLMASKIAIEAGLKFAKVYFVNCNLACDLPSFSPAKVSLCMVLFGTIAGNI